MKCSSNANIVAIVNVFRTSYIYSGTPSELFSARSWPMQSKKGYLLENIITFIQYRPRRGKPTATKTETCPSYALIFMIKK